jgi:ubiquinone/menaquinone biosynthesis C-methylase UbiE
MVSQQKPCADWGSIDYLDGVSEQIDVQMYRRHSFTLLDVQVGHHLLDVGCGTGEDVRALAQLVGNNGRVVGVDIREQLIAEAHDRIAGTDFPLEYRVGDIYRLDFPDSTFDGCRADRVFQHLTEPHRALAEMIRVARSGASVVAADPDWETFVIDAPDRAVTRRILDFNSDTFAHGWMGRQLPGLFKQAELREITIVPVTHVVTDFALADYLFFLQDTAESAQAAGVITHAEAIAWLDDLTQTSQEGRFFSALTLFVVGGRKR